jgi:hypothetical protein
MIRRKTLFVIGAGAGAEIGMPLGDKLSGTISDKLNIRFGSGNEQISGDHGIMDALRIIAAEEKSDVNAFRAAGCNVASGIRYTRSIDSYLYAHTGDENIKRCAKLAIIKTILEHEKSCAVFIDNGHSVRDFKNQAAVDGSWLLPFMNILQDRISKSANLDEIFQNVSIINFNYDRCIEQFLWAALQQLFLIEGDHAARLVSSLPIIHPYGTVGCLPWQSGAQVHFGQELSTGNLIVASNNIRTFNERVEEQDMLNQMAQLVNESERIVFLGMHYHEQNMELIRAAPLGRGGRVAVYGTAFQRSTSDIQIINGQIREMLNPRGGEWDIHLSMHHGCIELFKEFGTAIAR